MFCKEAVTIDLQTESTLLDAWRKWRQIMNFDGLDQIDEKILSLLKENARMSFSELGEKAGVSRVSARKRMEAMEKRGVIKGYHAEIDPTMLPEGVSFYLDIEADPACYEDVLENLASEKIIRQIYGVTGECMIHAVGFSPNQSQINYYANTLYRRMKGVRKIKWRTILTTYKDVDGGIDYVRYQEHEHLEE